MIANQMARMEGRIDDLVPPNTTVDLSDADWDRMIRVHLYGTFYGTRAALRHMTPARSGCHRQRLVGARPAADGGRARTTPQRRRASSRSPSRSGQEVAPYGVRVNAVCPGWIDTPLLARDGPDDDRGHRDADPPRPTGRRRGARRAGALPRAVPRAATATATSSPRRAGSPDGRPSSPASSTARSPARSCIATSAASRSCRSTRWRTATRSSCRSRSRPLGRPAGRPGRAPVRGRRTASAAPSRRRSGATGWA